MRPDELQERIRAILTARNHNQCPVPSGAIVEIILTDDRGVMRWPDARSCHGQRSWVWHRAIWWSEATEPDPVAWVAALWERYVQEPDLRWAGVRALDASTVIDRGEL